MKKILFGLSLFAFAFTHAGHDHDHDHDHSHDHNHDHDHSHDHDHDHDHDHEHDGPDGVSQQEITEMFNKFDTDVDGKVTKDEFFTGLKGEIG